VSPSPPTPNRYAARHRSSFQQFHGRSETGAPVDRNDVLYRVAHAAHIVDFFSTDAGFVKGDFQHRANKSKSKAEIGKAENRNKF
jgi:hypothetical protein